MANEVLKRAVCNGVAGRGDELERLSRTILSSAETGFREVKTAALAAGWLRANGLSPRTGVAITGVTAMLDTGREGPHIAVMGELDSLIVPTHPHAAAGTGAAHACGHHIQIGNMLGVAAALLQSGVLKDLCGRVTFMAVPAEEYIELEWREDLRAGGKVEFLGGKQEFIRLGELDSVDIAMMTHASSTEKTGLGVGGSGNGMVGKFVQFKGRAAHAGGQPWSGINALNAAHVALAAIHAQRETFEDSGSVRVHPIITRGGSVVNAVPDDVRMESYVRGASIEAIRDASAKVDRALRAGAMAVGAEVRVKTMPGYLPTNWDPDLFEVYRRNAVELVGAENVKDQGHRGGSTDMADVSNLLPAIHPYAHASTGGGHGPDYLVQDYGLAVVKAAQSMAMTIVDLLADGGKAARGVKARFKPKLTKDEYLALLRSFATDHTYDEGREPQPAAQS